MSRKFYRITYHDKICYKKVVWSGINLHEVITAFLIKNPEAVIMDIEEV